MKNITVSLLILLVATGLPAFAGNAYDGGLSGFSIAGTNGGAYTTNFANPPLFQLANTSGSTQTFAFETVQRSTGTTVSNVIHTIDFALTKGNWDTNTTVYVTNALNGTNWLYKLNTVTAPAHARWARHKAITMPAQTNQLTIDTAFGQHQP